MVGRQLEEAHTGSNLHGPIHIFAVVSKMMDFHPQAQANKKLHQDGPF